MVSRLQQYAEVFGVSDWQSLESSAYELDFLESTLAPTPEFAPFLHAMANEVASPLVSVLEAVVHKESTSEKPPLVIGMLGLQGAGKTTLSSLLQQCGLNRGVRIETVSIDDFYLTFEERKKLFEKDSRFEKRGPPGTHSIADIHSFFHQFKDASRSDFCIPRFDKSLHRGEGDRIEPESVPKPDVVIFEGWFLGAVPPLPVPDFNGLPWFRTPNEVSFAKTCHELLANYVPVWRYFDKFMVLTPENFHMSLEWRRQAEERMRAITGSGMELEKISEYVRYCWSAVHPEIYVRPYLERILSSDLTIVLNDDRSINRIATRKRST